MYSILLPWRVIYGRPSMWHTYGKRCVHLCLTSPEEVTPAQWWLGWLLEEFSPSAQWSGITGWAVIRKVQSPLLKESVPLVQYIVPARWRGKWLQFLLAQSKNHNTFMQDISLKTMTIIHNALIFTWQLNACILNEHRVWTANSELNTVILFIFVWLFIVYFLYLMEENCIAIN